MERRRRLLGLNRPGKTPQKNAVKTSKQTSNSGQSPKSSLEDKTIRRGNTNTSQKSQPSSSMTPNQKTPISHRSITPLKPESPCSPLQSPSSQIIFPGTLASPEIEVSWDWSCSQVPKDMLPPKNVKRKQGVKAQLPDLPNINMRLRNRPPLQREITEEENQQRLEYYKKILALRPQESNPGVSIDSTNNNVEDVPSVSSKSYTTPKRPTTRLSSASKKKNEDNSLFDDSANEFMFECSQAIEERLRKGEIDMGPLVDIEISQLKRPHSPGIHNTNSHKKTCHGRVNLFPENPLNSNSNVDNKDMFDSKLPKRSLTSNNNSHASNMVAETTQQNYCNKVEDKLDNLSLNVAMTSGDKTRAFQNPPDHDKTKIDALSNGLNERNQVQNVNINTSLNTLERRPLVVKPTQSTNIRLSNSYMTSNNRCSEMVKKSAPAINNNCVDVFHKPYTVSKTLPQNNQNCVRSQNTNNQVTRNQQNVKQGESSTTNQIKNTQKPQLNCTVQDKSNPADIKSLLDDDFDLELSCLDVDSLCRSSDNKEIQTKSAATSAPKLCTQQEIEAKRLAALQKLMMKRKR